ncbi:MAG: DNA-processing protein DprA [Betaproteobacteria bacterium]
MPEEELEAWLRLLLTPGVSRAQARRLLAVAGSPVVVFEQPQAVSQAAQLERLLPALISPPDDGPVALQATRSWLGAGEDRFVFALGDAGYPSRLLDIDDPPLLLFAAGALARQWSAGRGWAGPVLAVVDGAAHTGALEGGGPTVAVVGTGLDRVYPRRHLDLARRIVGSGAIVSEFLLGTPPLNHHFPQRNRILAGLASATLVVEANLKSGSLITARLAAEQGKEVMAIPGSIDTPQSQGCHRLIVEGARLVPCVQDVSEGLDHRPPLAAAHPPPASGKQAPSDDAVLQALGFEPTGLDALQLRCGWPTDRLQARLLELELAGQVAALPGGWWQRMAGR